MKQSFRRYLLHMAIGFVLYSFGLFAYNDLFGSLHHLMVKWLLLLLPMLPMLYVVTTILQYVSQMDEMQRKLIMENAAFAGLATAFTCFSFYFIRDLGAEIRPEAGYEVFASYYILGSAWSWWRLR